MGLVDHNNLSIKFDIALLINNIKRILKPSVSDKSSAIGKKTIF
jgi:hypothetical protein